MFWVALLAAFFGVSARAGGPPDIQVAPVVSYSCSAPDDTGMQPARLLCDALAAQLTERLATGATLVEASPGQSDGVHLLARLEDVRVDALKGRLVWTTCAGGKCEQAVAGPLVRTVVYDAVLSTYSYNSFARALLRLAQSPLDGPPESAIPLPWEYAAPNDP